MSVTIKDIAKKVGVSTATVSYVLNDTRQVSPETKKRVLEVAADLGYTPNTIARALVGKKTRSIAVAVSDHFCQSGAEAGLSGILQGIGNRTFTANYSFMLLFPERITVTALKDLQAKGIEGLISIGLCPPSEAKDEPPIPIVYAFFGDCPPADFQDLECIHFSYQHAFKLAMTHLSELGRTKIAVLSPSSRRDDSFQVNLAQFGSNLGASTKFYFGEPNAPGGYIAVDRLLAHETPDGVVAYSDSMAVGALHALARRGLKVPEDIAVIGCNDDPSASYSEPPLTTVRIPWEEIGHSAVDLFLGNKTETTVLPKLIIRESCGSSLWI